MKRISIILSLFAAIVCSTGSAYGQASTVGKEFWVSSSIVCSPAKNQGIVPYIAVSAEKACNVSISGGLNNAINITQSVRAGSWNEFGNSNKTYGGQTPYYNTNPAQGPINVQMDPSKWYPIDTKEPATVCNLAGQKFMYGLHITADQDISVYVILGGDNAMDASNILPLTALGSEYYTQDFMPEAHNDDSWSTNEGNMVTVTTILGTENGTQVEITPNGDTYDGHVSGTPYTISLNQGQIYYLISKKESQLAGTHIFAKNDKKIAIYTGSPLTRLPNGISARDALFEQPMPVDYWGTKFIVTRSLWKNGNIIGITASKPDTEIRLNGYTQATIQIGKTYYISLQNAGDPQGNKPGTSPLDLAVTGDALYIETSCPCAVFSYDTGNGYVGKGKDASGNVIDEIVEDGKKLGDPSSVWVSPIEQKIGQITFGTCYTEMTENHFLNIVAETEYCTNTTLYALYGANQIDKTNLLTWIPVPGNPSYSYARAQIGDKNTKDYSVFRLSNAKGFIATVYGNGKNESYAYSAGSAAVKRGVRINDRTFVNSVIPDSIPFCMNELLEFNAKISGSEDIEGVDWDFGDGVTLSGGEDVVQTTHTYDSPGWYDVSAKLKGRPACSDLPISDLGTVAFSFYVNKPDTSTLDTCICASKLPFSFHGCTFNEAVRDTVISDENCKHTYRLNLTIDHEPQTPTQVVYGRNFKELHDTIFYDSMDGWVWHGKTACAQCDSPVTYNIKIIHCLEIAVDRYAQTECPGTQLSIGYTKTKGNIKSAQLLIGGKTITLNFNNSVANGYFTADLAGVAPGTYPNAQVIIVDESDECQQQTPLDPFLVDISMLYPTSVFVRKYYNTLAVLNSAYNGGYNFVAYQWYKRDASVEGSVAQQIEGANNIIYYTSDLGMNMGYSVMLTRSDGDRTMSCERIISDNNADSQPGKNYAPEKRKLLKDQHLYIEVDGVIYDSMGNRVE